MKKRIIWTASIVVMLAAGAWGGYRIYGKEDKPTTPSLSTTQVRKGTIEVKVSGTGSIQPAARETLKASNEGTALKVNFKQGDAVKKGDVLITFEQEDVSDQVRSKELDLEKKQLDLTDLQTKYKEAIDDAAREAMKLSIRQKQLDIEMAQADIAALSTSKEIDPIIAPIDGILATFDVHTGDVINPNGDLGEIVNYAQLQMVVGIDELDIPKVKLNQEADIQVEALPDETYAGKVLSIADEGSTTNGVASFDVTIQLTEAKNLKVGMSAEASIMTANKTDALYVPIEAVQSSQGKYYVMVPGTSSLQTGQAPRANQNDSTTQADSTAQAGQAPSNRAGSFQNLTDEQRAALRAARGNGTANQRGAVANNNSIPSTTRVQVEIGINNEDNIEIISGLKEGDSVVLPTVVRTTANSNAQAGFPGIGGGAFSGAGGGFQGGAGGGRQTTGRAAGGAR